MNAPLQPDPAVTGPHLVGRTVSSTTHIAGGLTWKPEPRTLPLGSLSLANRIVLAQDGALEIAIFGDDTSASLASKARRIGGSAAKSLAGAQKRSQGAHDAMRIALDALDSAVIAADDARATLEAAEFAFGAGKGAWSDVEAATSAEKQAAARVRFAEKSTVLAEKAVNEANATLASAELDVAVAALDPSDVNARLDAITDRMRARFEELAADLAELRDLRERHEGDVWEAAVLAKAAGVPVPSVRALQPEDLVHRVRNVTPGVDFSELELTQYFQRSGVRS